MMSPIDALSGKFLASQYQYLYRSLSILLFTTVAACATTPPSNTRDVCDIFTEKRGWYKQSKRAFEQYGIPVSVQMAIIERESGFLHDAKPPRYRFLGIPLWRTSSAFGYAQVKDETWDWYISKTGNRGADRDDFADAVDFIGWYGQLSHEKLGISKWDAYNQYLAYHEGHGGYQQRSYKKKRWLMKAAREVEANAKRYGNQLKRCESELDKPWFWLF